MFEDYSLYEYGKKSSTYFLSLEKRFTREKLKKANDQETLDPIQIIQSLKRLFSLA